jgi:hypothetical protein
MIIFSTALAPIWAMRLRSMPAASIASRLTPGIPSHEFLDVDALPRPLPVDLGNHHLVTAFEVARDLLGVVCFRHEVQLVLDRLHELADDLLGR